jgi:malate dehydrogenase (oxaloacetate-decarboxylating)
MDDWELYPRVAAAIGAKAIELKLAGKVTAKSKIYSEAKAIIKRSRAITQDMMKKGYIKKSNI